MILTELPLDTQSRAETPSAFISLETARQQSSPIVMAPISAPLLRRYGPGAASGQAGSLAGDPAAEWADGQTEAHCDQRAVVLADETFWTLWGAQLAHCFEEAYGRVEIRPIAGTETCKTFDRLGAVLQVFCDLELDRRRDALFAIGGGAVLDLVGFAASIYRRGVAVTKIPTTLMAQVDAAVGLKNAINFNGTKNIVGSFCPPRSVLVDTRFLTSLPPRQFANGMAEILKIALVLDAGLFAAVAAAGPAHAEGAAQQDLYRRAIELMVRELNANPYEQILTRAVDFGHWLSPYVELQDPDLLHGEAVAIDIANSLMLSHRRGWLTAPAMAAALHAFRRFGLPLTHPLVSARTVQGALDGTVKSRGGRQNIPLCTGIGSHAFACDLTVAEVLAADAALRHWAAKTREEPAAEGRLAHV